MKKVGYPAVKAAAIEVASSVNGQLAPPVMGAAAFIIAEYVNVPYVEVAKAAAIPAFASYSALLWITHVEACKLGLRGLRKRREHVVEEVRREHRNNKARQHKPACPPVVPKSFLQC